MSFFIAARESRLPALTFVAARPFRPKEARGQEAAEKGLADAMDQVAVVGKTVRARP
jgi:hypothetical protein